MRKLAALLLLILFAGLLGTEFFFFKNSHVKQIQEKIASKIIPKNIYTEFIGEVYDLIKNEHWENIEDSVLSERFALAAQELGYPSLLKPAKKEEVLKMIAEIIGKMEEQKKKEFITKTVDLVLASLRPQGRSRLYSQLNEEALRNMVANANPESDHYKTLGVSQESPQEKIEEAFEQKVKEIKKEEKPEEAVKKIVEAEKAYETVKTPQRRELYDKYKIEPTVTNKFIKPGILYLPIKRISPQTFKEFVREVESIKPQERGDALIIDLRGNIGGSIDILQDFLGPFIGPNQYAFEFYRKGKPIPFKTTSSWLESLTPYKNVVILVDEKTQSSAEVIAATLKKYNVGVVLGRKTKGWGTIEKVFKLRSQIDPGQTFSVFLVHTITLRDDSQPIEGRGVEPLINIDSPDWDKELFKYVRRNDLVDTVKELVK